MVRGPHCRGWGCGRRYRTQSRTEGRKEGKEGCEFLTVGRASRGDGGFVRQLQETVGNTETAQMGEGAGGFLLQRDMCQSAPWPYHNTRKITPNRRSLAPGPRCAGAWKAFLSGGPVTSPALLGSRTYSGKTGLMRLLSGCMDPTSVTRSNSSCLYRNRPRKGREILD